MTPDPPTTFYHRKRQVPGIPLHGAILKGLELIRQSARGQHLTLIDLVIDAGDVAHLVQFHAQQIVFQQGGRGNQ
jgi:hypothetical protein